MQGFECSIFLGYSNTTKAYHLYDVVSNKLIIKIVFKNKYKSNDSLEKHKSRLMTKGFAQKEGIHYEDTFSSTTKWATIHTLFSLVAHNGWNFH
jgi:vacuolar-type H+-ATPase catalytic subunit A/Vma1